VAFVELLGLLGAFFSVYEIIWLFVLSCSARPSQTAASTPTPTRGANSVPVATKENYAHGRVNHDTVEEAQEAPDVVVGIFFINATSAVVLFDSIATHSFISAAYVEKHNLHIALLKCQVIVSSPRGDMPTRQLCPKVNLKIRGVDFIANLIVLDSKGIDVIRNGIVK
jgi:hypothetical protein